MPRPHEVITVNRGIRVTLDALAVRSRAQEVAGRAGRFGPMLKKIVVVALAASLAMVGVVYVLYRANTAPVTPEISAAEVSNPSKPFVVKLHARWCPVCMITTSVWSQIEQEYSGRVNLLVLDFTDDQTTNASRALAERVGMGRLFEETASTGVVLVVDGRTKEVTAAIAGSRDFAEYRVAIDAALNGSPSR